jgi:CheY-like chemotaxis protein
MDKSDVEPTPRSTPHRTGDAIDLDHWRGLVAELGAETAAPLTSALERIVALTTSGHIDRQSLRSLREEVERARQVGIDCQQLARLASGRVRQNHERVQLAEMLGGALSHRTRAIQARGIGVKLVPGASVEVLVDAPLLFSLINTLLDWALECAGSTIELRLDIKAWPAHARLTCRFEHHPVTRLDDGARAPTEVSAFDSMRWRLLQQTARAMALPLERVVEAGSTALSLEFPRTVNESMEGASAVEIDEGFAASINTKPLAGNHVLVVARRRDVRVQVRDALRDMGLIVDFVASVEEAVDFCREGLPHAIVVESVLCGERFNELRQDITAEVPEFVFIEIIEDSRAFEMSGFNAAGMARVGRDVMAQSLPSALLFELARGG